MVSPPPASTVSIAGWQGAKPGDLKILRIGDQEIHLRWCPRGSFKMGSPTTEPDRGNDEDQVDVTLTRGFWMLETEVAQGLWAAVMKTELDWSSKGKGKGPNLPVYNVSYAAAVKFCDQLTALLHADRLLSAGLKISLPTEAQWEYAARAGTTERFPFGDYEGRLGQYAWFSGNSGERPHDVGKLTANSWGLLDMLGNVWEWCLDGYADKLPGGVDPAGSPGASNRVIRGGSWNDAPGNCRPAVRIRGTPGSRGGDLGFRVVAVQE